MARKPAKSKAHGQARRAKPKRRHPEPQTHAQGWAKRLIGKHNALRGGAQFAAIGRFLRQTVHIPYLDHPVSLTAILAFVGVLGVAVGGGYWGAQNFFGGGQERAGRPSTSITIQQTHKMRGVILPEPGTPAEHKTRAYEEHAVEEVYEPPVSEAIAKPESAPQQPKPPVEVARTPPPAKTLADGTRPRWLQNAMAFTPAEGQPMIAIVIDDMGVDRNRSRHMWEDVPGPLTLSFLTYANDLPAQTQAARQNGHELMLHMSMEPSNEVIDAGPNVLMTTMPSREIRSLANWGMDRFDGFVGVNNHMGSRFTENERGMRAVLEEIKKRDLIFLDSRTSSHTVGVKVARELGMPVLERNVFLDNDNVPEKVRTQLDELERLARKHGRAIAIGHPRDATIEVLKSWIPAAKARGLSIVPVSSLMKDRLQRQAQNAGVR